MRRAKLPAGAIDASVKAYLYVDKGRLFVRCPWCPSIEYAHTDDHRFFCSDCLNAPVKGAPIEVVWPDEFEEGEAVLNRRPDRATRNWLLGETVDDLRAENIAHGVA